MKSGLEMWTSQPSRRSSCPDISTRMSFSGRKSGGRAVEALGSRSPGADVEFKDYYEIPGVPQDADQKTIGRPIASSLASITRM